MAQLPVWTQALVGIFFVGLGIVVVAAFTLSLVETFIEWDKEFEYTQALNHRQYEAIRASALLVTAVFIIMLSLPYFLRLVGLGNIINPYQGLYYRGMMVSVGVIVGAAAVILWRRFA